MATFRNGDRVHHVEVSVRPFRYRVDTSRIYTVERVATAPDGNTLLVCGPLVIPAHCAVRCTENAR
ncbi:hypothetical protein [Azospirillum sp. ST 5-10]|uniref:hypothetical protein n=1 Tax=unclassified Azospirillum TaxID=2630922 RepID=UPI003F49F820